jgi:hypothetical protein
VGREQARLGERRDGQPFGAGVALQARDLDRLVGLDVRAEADAELDGPPRPPGDVAAQAR